MIIHESELFPGGVSIPTKNIYTVPSGYSEGE